MAKKSQSTRKIARRGRPLGVAILVNLKHVRLKKPNNDEQTLLDVTLAEELPNGGGTVDKRIRPKDSPDDTPFETTATLAIDGGARKWVNIDLEVEDTAVRPAAGGKLTITITPTP